MHTANTSNYASIAGVVLSLQMGICASSLHAQDAVNSGVASSEAVTLFEQTIDQGILFIDGEFVRPPYVIEAAGNRVTVNGLTCFEAVIASTDNRAGHEDRRRRRRDKSDDGSGEDSPRTRPSLRAAEGLAESLENGRIVVAQLSGPLIHLRQGGEIFTFCEAMLAADRSPQMVNEFIRLSKDESQFESWRFLLSSSSPHKELRIRLQQYLERLKAVEAEGVSRAAAIVRMETFAYPLTLAGMLVGVIALGHVLKWTARSIVAEQREDYAPEVTRCVEIALLLMLVMSAIDLAWTILAGQAGAMREINPLAAGLILSPLHLITLKVFATGLGCGILYAWRQRKQVQNATWWMCLVCVLLTFRWVVFDSVIG